MKLHIASFWFLLTLSVWRTFPQERPPYYAPDEQLPLVILICSYNNAPWVAQNLDSVFMQHYDNYRILYIDDCSEDETASCVRTYKEQHDTGDRLTLQVNQTRVRKMKNMYNAVHSCDDHEIIVQLDGDDWFCDDQLFARVNHIYKTTDVWLTYGSYIDVPGDVLGYAKPTDPAVIEHQSFRTEPWIYMPTRTFYAWLFKQIRLQDFIAEQVKDHQGLFFPSADDPAFMFPMLEMAGDHFAFMEEISYVANRDNPIIGRTLEPSLQGACGCDIRYREPYGKLDAPYLQTKETPEPDVLLFSTQNTACCMQALNALQHNASGFASIYVLYETAPDAEYASLLNKYPSVRFFSFAQMDTLLSLLKQNYLLLLNETTLLKESINLKQHCKHLDKTGAYGFYFDYAPDRLPFGNEQKNDIPILFQHVYDDVYAWKFNCGQFALFNNYAITLVRSIDFITRSKTITNKKNCASLAQFLKAWLSDTHVDMHDVGLFSSQQLMNAPHTPITTTIKLPPYFDPPPGRGYRTPADIERKRVRKERLQERWRAESTHEISTKRRLKKRRIEDLP